jgi:small-conductance mechanosensitive channel
MAIFHDLLNPATLPGSIVYGIIFLILAIVLARILRHWATRIASHADLGVDQTALRFVSQLLQLFCFIFAAIFYAHLVPFLHTVGTAMLASASVAFLVIGDVLTVNAPTGKETGTVREFTLGYTKLPTDDGRWIIVPNSVMMTTTIIRNK